MKPRPSAPLTPEDASIWGWVSGRWFRRYDQFLGDIFDLDRRNATLMWWARDYGQINLSMGHGFSLVWRFGSGVVGAGLSEIAEILLWLKRQ